MNTQKPVIPNPSSTRFDDTLEFARSRGRRRQQAKLAAWVGTTGLALLATIALLEGCSGGSSSKLASEVREPQTASSVDQNVVAAMSLPATGEHTSLAQPLPIERGEDAGSVPPDVIAAVSDTFVTAGQAVQVRVEGTPDITQMALADGRGDAIPMVRDSSSNVWRVAYRVPLRPLVDRLGLAVTAQNESHRWRRVWLFLTVDDGRHGVETETPDVLPSEK